MSALPYLACPDGQIKVVQPLAPRLPCPGSECYDRALVACCNAEGCSEPLTYVPEPSIVLGLTLGGLFVLGLRRLAPHLHDRRDRHSLDSQPTQPATLRVDGSRQTHNNRRS